METSDFPGRLSDVCSQVGFDLGSVAPLIIERLTTLEAHSPVVADAERISAEAFAMFRYYESTKPDRAFTPDEQRVVVLASIFSDIGKTGPLEASPGVREHIAEMFSVEGVKDDSQTVKSFLRRHFPEDAEERVWQLEALDLDPEMSIRTFWNLHSRWTFDVLRAGGLPPEVVAAAATHHLLEDINPDSIVGVDRRFAHSSGNNLAFDRAEKLVIVLDKYDAARRRGQLSHGDAVAWLRKHVATHPEFAEDQELAELMQDLDVVGANFATRRTASA